MSNEIVPVYADVDIVPDSSIESAYESSSHDHDPVLNIRMRSDSDIDIISSIFEIHINDSGSNTDTNIDIGNSDNNDFGHNINETGINTDTIRDNIANNSGSNSDPSPLPEWALPTANTNEDTNALMFSYNTIMADFQHNMMVYQQNVSDAVIASRPHLTAPNSSSEDIGAMMYSYNTIMSDFQHNMMVYQRNIGSIISLSRNIIPLPRSRLFERNLGQGQGQGPGEGQPSARIFRRIPRSISRTHPESERIFAFNRNTESSAIETSEYVGGIDEICPISLETFVPGERVSTIRICNHKFREDALAEWFARDNNACPVCRRTVRITSPQTAAIRTAAQVMLALERVSRVAGL